MGRGNICTCNEFEGLYYLDKKYIEVYNHVSGDPYIEPKTAHELDKLDIPYSFSENTDWKGEECFWNYSEFETQYYFDEMISSVTDYLMKRFPSFYVVDFWHKRDNHVLLQNSYFNIALADNEWSYAWMLLERDDIWDLPSERNLMAKHYNSYLEGIKSALIDIYGEAIGYGGVWSHGTRYTRDSTKTNFCSI